MVLKFLILSLVASIENDICRFRFFHYAPLLKFFLALVSWITDLLDFGTHLMIQFTFSIKFKSKEDFQSLYLVALSELTCFGSLQD